MTPVHTCPPGKPYIHLDFLFPTNTLVLSLLYYLFFFFFSLIVLPFSLNTPFLAPIQKHQTANPPSLVNNKTNILNPVYFLEGVDILGVFLSQYKVDIFVFTPSNPLRIPPSDGHTVNETPQTNKNKKITNLRVLTVKKKNYNKHKGNKC